MKYAPKLSQSFICFIADVKFEEIVAADVNAATMVVFAEAIIFVTMEARADVNWFWI